MKLFQEEPWTTTWDLALPSRRPNRRLQHHEIQNTHSGAGTIFSWSACGLQGEALCCIVPKISSQPANFTQQRDMRAWQAPEGHRSQPQPHHHPSGICPGRTAFHRCRSPSETIDLPRTGAAWKLYGAFMSSRPVFKERGRMGSGAAGARTPHQPLFWWRPPVLRAPAENEEGFQQVTLT